MLGDKEELTNKTLSSLTISLEVINLGGGVGKGVHSLFYTNWLFKGYLPKIMHTVSIFIF